MLKKICLTFVLLIVTQAVLLAGNDILVTPPPIPWFEFNEKQFDLRVSASYATIKGDDLDARGGSIGFLGRYGVSNTIGWDFGFSYIGGGGSGGTDTNIEIHNWTLSTNIEIQPIVGRKSVNLILFLGLSVPLTLNTIWVGSTTVEAFSVMYGPQFGMQLSLGLGPIEFNPFVKIQVITGSYSSTTWTSSDTRYRDGDIETFTIPVVGFDLIFKSINLTLSSLLQFSQSEDKHETVLFSASYTFHWDNKSDSVKQ